VSGVPRFTASERLWHWAFALGYLALLASGLPLTFEGLRGLIRDYTPVIGVRLHLAFAALWLAAPLAVVLLGDRRALARAWRDLVTFAPGDGAWLRSLPRWLAGGARERARIDRAVGRFNAGQKLNAIFTAATAGLLLLTGLALVPLHGSPLVAWCGTPALVHAVAAAHRWLSLVVVVPIAAHVFMAAAFPATRPSLSGMLTGDVDREYAARHHPRWRPAAGARAGDDAA